MSEEQIILTPEGFEKCKKELHELKTVKRKEIAERIETAKALGDLSENAEYQDAKEESAWVEGRIIKLSDILARGTIAVVENGDTVTVGHKIIVKNGDKERTFVIVGANEADPVHGRISSGSPLGAAFLGKRPGDMVEVNTPGGIQHYEILKIE